VRPGGEEPVILTIKYPNFVHAKLPRFIDGYDGKTAWWFMGEKVKISHLLFHTSGIAI